MNKLQEGKMKPSDEKNVAQKLAAKRKLSKIFEDVEKIAKELAYLEMPNESAFLKNALKQIKRTERSL